MFRKKSYIIILVSLLALTVIMSLPGSINSRLKLIAGGIFIPIFGVSSALDKTGEKLSNIVIPEEETRFKLKQLEEENQRLKIQIMQFQTVLDENLLLRSNLNWQARSPWKLKAANVVARDPSMWWKGVHIDIGLKDGIRPNLPVITTDGLVGRIEECAYTRSVVVLLGDPKCRVSVVVPEAKDCGIIAPSQAGFFNGKYVDLMYLTRGNELKPGQAVYTSGLGNIFPEGIYVGRIVDIRSADGLYLEARVQVGANLNSLNVVWVILK